MKTVCKTVYLFSELSEKAQQKALNECRYMNVDHDWWHSTYEDAGNIGLKLEFFDLDWNRYATGFLTLSAAEVAQNILNGHGEMCGTYVKAEEFLEEFSPVFAEYMTEPENMAELEEKLMDMENEFTKNLLEEYSLILQNEYEYLTSDEAVGETIEANGLEFNEDGSLA